MNKKIYSILRLLVFLPCLLYVVSYLNPDPDSYFLIATGRYILKNGIPEMNPFIHMDAHIVVQQWAVCVLNALIFDNFGVMGLNIYSGILIVLISILSFLYISLFTKNSFTKFLNIIYTVSGLFIFLNTRPNSITILLILCLLMVLEKHEQTKNNFYLILLPIISIIQINVHAAMWFVLFPFMCVYLLSKTLQKKIINFKKWPLFIAIIVSFFAGFINPNGSKSVFYILNSVGTAVSMPIAEMRKTEYMSYCGAVLLIAIVLLTVYICKNKKYIDVHLTLLGFAGIFYGMMYVRNLYFVPICITGILGSVIKYKEKEKTEKEYLIVNICYAALMIVVLVLFPMDAEIKGTNMCPVESINYLDTKENVKLFAGFNTGSYAEFRGYKTYIDGRAEIYGQKITQTEDYIKEYLQVYSGNINYDDFMDKYQFTHVLVSVENMFDTYLAYNDNYKLIIEENECKLYERIK